ncbi:MAG: mechanosensitive ion channel [Deltaproteobacteria bacterium]|nr:mechanosensitive ion channel [Deltaproteobacteria bacterium]
MDLDASLAERLTQADAWIVGGWGAGLGFVVWALLQVVLPANRRTDLRFPLTCLTANALLCVLHAVFRPQGTLLWGVALLAVLLAAGRLGFLLVVDLRLRPSAGRPMPAIFRDILQGFVYAAVVFISLRSAGMEPGSLLTTSALLTAVIGLALQETLGNVVAGLAIQGQRPFEEGDWIQFDNDPRHVGQVLEINWRATKLFTEDRVEVVVPNGPLAKSSIINFSKPTPLMRRTLDFSLPLPVPPRRARDAALRAVRSVDGVLAEPPPQVLVTGYKDAFVVYQARYFVDRFEQRETIDGAVNERVWYALERAGAIARPAMTDEEVASVTKRLQGIDFLKALSEEQLALLARSIQRRTYIPGDAIITEGEEGDELFIIHSGQVKILVRGSAVAHLEAGAFFGEMSLLTGERRSATVVAVDEVQAYVVGHPGFTDVLNRNPGVVDVMSRAVAERQMALLKARAAADAQVPPIEEHSSQLLARIKSFFSIR